MQVCFTMKMCFDDNHLGFSNTNIKPFFFIFAMK